MGISVWVLFLCLGWLLGETLWGKPPCKLLGPGWFFSWTGPMTGAINDGLIHPLPQGRQCRQSDSLPFINEVAGG